jgi:hypothetical protein
MQRFIGSDVAIGGELIWRGVQQNKKVTKDGQQVGWRYFLPCAISFGRTMTDQPIVGIRELYANGRLHYSSYEAVSITSSDIAATLVSVNEYDPLTDTTVVIQTYLDLTAPTAILVGLHVGGKHPDGGGGVVIIDSASTPVGLEITGRTIVDGFTAGAAVNNGTFIAVSVSTTRIRLKHETDDVYPFVTASAGDVVTITQQESHYLKQGFMTIHRGGVPQDPDELMVEREGAANVPNYDGLTYITFGSPLIPLHSDAHKFTGFDVSDFGLSAPAFRARIKERNSVSLAGAVHDILFGYGMDE